MAKHKGGRPTIMTPDRVKKLEEVFAIGGTDEEACFFADISRQTLYDYQTRYPEFVDRKEALKQKPFLKARRTIDKSLDNPNFAFEYMKRKKKDEFSERNEVSGKNGGAIEISQTITGFNYIKPDDAHNQTIEKTARSLGDIKE